ncbi:MAG: O-antigen ligase family protein [bacterium]
MDLISAQPLKTILLATAAIAYLGSLWLCARWFNRRPADAMALMMAVAPLEVLSFYKGLTIKPFLLLYPAVILGVGWRYRDWLSKRPELSDWDWCILTCWGWALFSCFFAPDPMRGIRMAIQVGMVLAVSIGTAHLVNNRDEIERYLRFFKWSAIGVCAYALWQAAGYFLGPPSQPLLALARLNPTLPRMLTEPGAIVFSENLKVVRVSSTFFDWNIFSAYLVILLSLFLYLVWRGLLSGRLPARVFWGLILLVATWLLTFSRSGWLGGAAAVVVLIGFGFPIRHLVRRYVVVIACLVVVCVIAQINPVGVLFKRVGQSVTGERSVQEHAWYGLAALDMLHDRPLTGVGIHNYAVYYQRNYDPNEPGATAHSGFLSIFAEMGMVGGIALVLTFLMVASKLWKTQRNLAVNDPDGMLLRALLAAAIGLGVCNIFYHFWTQLFLWCFFGFCIGATEGLGRGEMTENAEESTA